MPPNTPVTTILFDLDDTLLDHMGTAWAVLAATAAGRATLRGVPVENLYGHYSELLEKLHPQVMTGRTHTWKRGSSGLRGCWRPTSWTLRPLTPPNAEHHHGHHQQLQRPVVGALALLQALKLAYKLAS